jgi:uncharacterized protein (DUF952 family)
VILHLVAEDVWRAVPPGEPYAPGSLATEGFVHCTAGEELLVRVANTFYRDDPSPYLVLDVDESRLAAEVRWESPPGDDPLGTEVRFPHVYGPIDAAAVVAVRRADRRPDGTFTGVAPYPPS